MGRWELFEGGEAVDQSECQKDESDGGQEPVHKPNSTIVRADRWRGAYRNFIERTVDVRDDAS